MTQLKILKICGSKSWGGLEKFFLESSEKLQNTGHNVTIACPVNSNIFVNAANKNLNITSFNFSNKITAIRKLTSLLKTSDFDIIHSHYSNDLWSVIPAIKQSKSKAKLVLTKAMESGVSKKDLLHRQLYKRVDAIIAISKYIAANVEKTTPVPKTKITIINDAVDTNIFNPSLFNRKKLREERGIKDETVLTFLGRITLGKGLEDLINAVEIIRTQSPEQKIIILVAGSAIKGEEKYEIEIKNIVKQKKLNNVFTFLGYCTNTAEILACTDILVFPSHTESFGITVIEAMAMGVPVAASNYGGILDSIEHNKTGILFERKNPASLANAVTKLIKDPQLRIILGTAGRLRAKKEFNMNIHTERTVKLYEKLLT
jgi:glycosyltransferase involved in cell wall biosynthesis